MINILIFTHRHFTVMMKNRVTIENSKKQCFNEFAASWMKLDYLSMYNELSTEYRKNTTENDFRANLIKIYGDTCIDATNIKITPDFSNQLEDKEGELHIPYIMTMKTIAGNVSIRNEAVFIEEKKDSKDSWTVMWNDKMIFPQMEQGDTVSVDYILAKRGQIKDRNGKPLALNDATSRRIYPLKDAAAQLVGYTKAISLDELKKLKSQ